SGMTVSNLAVGSYPIEFKPITGYAAPLNREVEVFAGYNLPVQDYYRQVSPPQGVWLPVPLTDFAYITSSVTNNPQMPFAFNGQLHSELGFGSGVAVGTNVVLTAAHVVFSDLTLSYATLVDWYFQRQAGEFDPLPLRARGIHILSG